jgi:hypothetical protein
VRHPFDLPSDFPYARLGRDYASGDYTIDEICAAYDIPRDVFMAIRRAAPKRWTKRGPNLWWDDLDEDESDLARRAADEQKAARVGRKAKRREQRELERAAENWWQFESAIGETAKAFQAEAYDAPRPILRVGSNRGLEPAAALYNAQDFHVGARPAKSPDSFRVAGYCDALLKKTKKAFEDAVRLRQLERIYVIVGGDLVHADTTGGTTSKGTQLDMACSPTEALQRAIGLMARVVDLARSIASEVVLVPVRGNHDRALSAAAAMALTQRYHQTPEVTSHSIEERQYLTYYEHLFVCTHGDITKKAMREIGDTIRAEARGLLGKTAHTSLATGHLHHRARDMEDQSGRVHYQAPSPALIDAWHSKEAFVGSRRGVQLILFDRESGGDRLIHA